ncbi:uncharacterized protein LOC113305058 [Papaver somniferum]|uniref:uncharacterized protein LOC113305058 n=1 Tax=Papaver somniferum TaxID=3469 RepID=UPI000E6FA71D|nr:uncharacterized protein LOC113305058 [Papaver somniferum]
MTGKESGKDSTYNGERKIDPSSLYYLHPSDHTCMVISPVKLNGDNYEEWFRSMRNAFRARRKYSFLDGNITQPKEDDPDIEDWWSVNSMLIVWIATSIESNLRSTITYYEKAKELWDDLKQRFSIGNGPRMMQLRSNLAKCKQDGQAIAAYFGRLKFFWEELSNHVKPPLCRCNKCTCLLAAQWNKQREEERVHRFFMGLDDIIYGTVLSHIISQDPLYSLSRVYALVVQEERHQTIARTRDVREEAVGFALQAPKTAKGPVARMSTTSANKPTCKNCGKSGHEMENCFRLVGYPDWWLEKHGKRNGGGLQQGSNNRKGKPSLVVANAANFPTGGGENFSGIFVSTQDRTTLMNTLTDSQLMAIENMLNPSNKEISKEKQSGKGILDSEASRHMTGRKDLLLHLQQISLSPIGLPNDTYLHAQCVRTVVSGPNLKLNHVLFVSNT